MSDIEEQEKRKHDYISDGFMKKFDDIRDNPESDIAKEVQEAIDREREKREQEEKEEEEENN
jgi:hypothetical protein